MSHFHADNHWEIRIWILTEFRFGNGEICDAHSGEFAVDRKRLAAFYPCFRTSSRQKSNNSSHSNLARSISTRLHTDNDTIKFAELDTTTEKTPTNPLEGLRILQPTDKDKAQDQRFSRRVLKKPQSWVSQPHKHSSMSPNRPDRLGMALHIYRNNADSISHSSQKEGTAEDVPRGLLD
jgi:hypothetical protein